MIHRLFVVVCVVLAMAGTVAWTDNPGSSEEVCTRPDVILCDDWEDGDNVGWGWSDSWACGGGGREVCIEDIGGFGTPNAIRLRIQENVEDTAYPDHPVNVDVTTSPVYMRWYIKYSEGFVFMPGYSDGEKMAYLRSDGSSGLDWRIMFGAQAQSADNRSVFQITVSSLGHTPVWTHNSTAPHWLEDDTWYCVEGMLIGGHPGQSDGQMKLWVNDELYFDHTGMETKTDGDPINRVQFTSWYGGNPGPDHPEQWVWYDNIVVATQRIGCVGSTDSGGEAPPDVTNLHREDTTSEE